MTSSPEQIRLTTESAAPLPASAGLPAMRERKTYLPSQAGASPPAPVFLITFAGCARSVRSGASRHGNGRRRSVRSPHRYMKTSRGRRTR